MVKKLLITFLSLLVFLSSFSQETPLKLWYNTPSAKWTDALPIGNGRLGAMIFGGADSDRIQFNEETLWTGEPRDYNCKGAYKYLSQIRQLLFEGKQKEAEQLAEENFMGLKSKAGDKQAWVKKVRASKNLVYASLNYDDSQWKQIHMPSYEGWEAEGFEGLDGAVWFRTSFELPANWKGKDLVLDLNKIRDQDFTYVNGKLIGTTESTKGRKYVVPKNILKSGRNLIAVQVLNFYDKGGIAGYKHDARAIGIFPEGKESEKISLIKDWKYFIQDDEPPPVARYEAAYQPFGDIWLQFNNKDVSNYKRELDISNAVARTSYTSNGINYTREYLASQPDQVIAIHFTASKPASISFECLVNSPHKYASTKKIDNKTLALSVNVKFGALKGESYLKVDTKNGTAIVENNKIVVTNADEVTLYLTAATNYKTFKDISADPVALCKKYIQGIEGKSYAQIKSAAVKEYQGYFKTLSVDFGSTANANLPTDERIEKFASSSDPSLVALYMQYGRYLLIASSRPGTRPANLQGIWNDLLSPPWDSKYTTNINLEMNYWPAELLNLSPMHQPLFKMMEELVQTGSETAKQYYDAPGWVLHHNTDLWRATAPINASNHGIWVGGSGWLSDHLWQHYLFTQSKKFLRDTAYPIMKKAALFYNSFLVRDPKTGWWLISGPSNSPEHGGLVMGPTMDHSIIRSLFKAVISSGEIFNVDKSFRDTLQKKLSQMAPYEIGKYGQLQEWLQDVDDTTDKHRHVSHLWAVYPGNEISWQDSSFMKAARQSLLYRGDAATGWSLAWKLNLWARFKEGDHAYRLLQMLLSPAEKFGEGSYHNLFDAHPPFQIDGNFGGAAGIGEMLVQSHSKYIDLLPALPSALADGQVNGICARGGFQLNLQWKNGVLQSAGVLSLAGNDCHMRYKDKTISFKTKKGQTYQLNGDLQLL